MITYQQLQMRITLALERLLEAPESSLLLDEDHSFYIFRTDTNAVLARGIQGFDAAKEKANQLRRSHGLKWDQVKFKAERKAK